MYSYITMQNLDKYIDELQKLGLIVMLKKDNLTIFTTRFTKKKFIVGTITCPYCKEKIELSIVKRPAIGRYVVEQDVSAFKNHMELKHKEEFERAWIKLSREPYQQGSWHIVRRYVCRKCNYKSRRYTDVLIHIITRHRFLISS